MPDDDTEDPYLDGLVDLVIEVRAMRRMLTWWLVIVPVLAAAVVVLELVTR